MAPELWQQIKPVLDRALELQGDERAGYLATACAGDASMRTEVESLIASLDNGADILESPPLAAGEIGPGHRVGPYRIVAEIGRGGMGTVYRGVRADDHFKKQVAIKIVKRGVDNEHLLRRFLHERQIMASLEHPNIARLLDGGTTDDGLPYFVMEYIEGKPIDVYCDERRLSIFDRLKLFQTVCSAVEYAHRNMIVHRDIKPANILVTAAGEPKLLDFGIAKIFNPEISTQAGDSTATVLRLMTPEYASPEQIRGEPITEATDVYALGVLLYELLTGHRPYRLRSRAPHDLAHAICETEPDRPSTVITRLEQMPPHTTGQTVTLTPQTVAAARGIQPERLRRSLSGDLDNIILMAMRKEAERRYTSARQLAQDIQLHLDGRPVIARPDTLIYRTAKLLERNRPAVMSVAVAAPVIALLLLGGIYISRTAPPSVMGSGPLQVTPFTTLVGDETQPAFSPDGTRIAYVWSGENNENADVYVRALDSEAPLRLTTDPADDVSPTWSPDGSRIAFLRIKGEETAVFVSPAGNGIHSKIADVYPTRVEAVGRHLDWSPDGRFLAVADKASVQEPFSIYLLRVANGEKQKLSIPPERFVGDSSPAFSPDGQMLSFIRSPSSGVTDIYVVSMRSERASEAHRVTFDNRDILSQTWTADGRHIVYSSNRSGTYSLWQVSPSGGTSVRLPMGENTSEAAFSRDGRYMVFTQFFRDANIWRLPLAAPGRAAGPARKLISSTQYDSSAQYSPDGAHIAFRSSRAGGNEIWVADANGRHAVQLTRFGGSLTGTPRWSPDGEWIAFDSRPEGQPDIFVVPARGGPTRRMTRDTSEDVVPSWSRDGKWIYFASNRSGTWQVWKVPFSDPSPSSRQQVTQNGGFAAFESPDGNYLYYAKGRGVRGLWRKPLPGGEEEPVVPHLEPGFWGYWAVTRDGIYFVDQLHETQPALFFLDPNGGPARKIADIEKTLAVGDSALAVSPDGRNVLYTQIDQSGSDIMMVENFHAPR